MNDRHIIRIEDLAVSMRVGVSDTERAYPQPLLIGVTLELVDPPHFADHDDLRHTIDYESLIGHLRDTLPGLPPMHLIETIADKVARFALTLSRRILTAEAVVKKPSVLGPSGLVSVAIKRQADHAHPRQSLGVLDHSTKPAERAL
ncbi:MAG: dihydroneopterin aldolase [Caulobacterales bacterium]|jgi:FolB domain-containing protein